jgi:hypothetical protein
MHKRLPLSQKYSKLLGFYSIGRAGFSPKLKWLKHANGKKIKSECNSTSACLYPLKAYKKHFCKSFPLLEIQEK